ncbi:RSP_7527 family protein [Rhodanobacter aciditrophus]|uniref:RSP_7527 family protein n=1 Tax=Rhodanobacter aciditrophus TaxID=1623218 RepID=A0ABW4AZF0_9GAMM
MNNTSYDNLDTDFYVERAYELRRLYVAAAVKNFALRVKAFFTPSPRSFQGKAAH